MKRFTLAVLAMFAMLIGSARADTELVFEDFETYADDAALFSVWRPASGNSTIYWTPADPAYLQAALVDASYNPAAFPSGGKGVAHLGGVDSTTNTAVLEWIGLGPNGTGPVSIAPSATQKIVVEGDIFDSGAFTANRRMSIGLRSTSPANLVELGFWNASTCDPTVAGCVPGGATPPYPGDYPATQYAGRTALFGTRDAPLVTEPNWQYFQLPLELDRTTDTDEIVNKGDIGEGWHHWKAEISETSVTFTIDLFRDGVRNDTRDDAGVVVGVGTAGVPDATMTFPVHATLAGFNSLRIGAPSGLTSVESPAGNEVIFDNIRLALVDITSPGINADFNGNGVVDAADYVLWRKNNGLMGGASQSMGDSNGDGNVDATDYTNWKATFGANVPGSGAAIGATAIPEPATLLLTLIMASLAATVRRAR